MNNVILDEDVIKLIDNNLKTGEEIYLDAEQIQQIKDALAWSKNK